MRWLLLSLVLVITGCAGTFPFSAVQIEPIPMFRDPPAPAEPAAEPAPGWTRIGFSIRGRPIEVAEFGGRTDGPRIYILGGLRGDEPEGPRAAEQLAAILMRAWPEPDTVENASQWQTHPWHGTVRIVRDVNPDGTSRNQRTNTRGVDLTRNWPTACFHEDPVAGPGGYQGRGPASEIEVAAVHRDLLAFDPDIVIVFGSSARGPWVTCIDPSQAPATKREHWPRAQRLAFEFANGARRIDPRWRTLVNGGGSPALSGSIEALVAQELGRPVLIVNFQRGQDDRTTASAARYALESLLSPVAAGGELWWPALRAARSAATP